MTGRREELGLIPWAQIPPCAQPQGPSRAWDTPMPSSSSRIWSSPSFQPSPCPGAALPAGWDHCHSWELTSGRDGEGSRVFRAVFWVFLKYFYFPTLLSSALLSVSIQRVSTFPRRCHSSPGLCSPIPLPVLSLKSLPAVPSTSGVQILCPHLCPDPELPSTPCSPPGLLTSLQFQAARDYKGQEMLQVSNRLFSPWR